MGFAVRTMMDTRGVKEAVLSVDPGQPVLQIRAMDDHVSLAETSAARHPHRSDADLALRLSGLGDRHQCCGVHNRTLQRYSMQQ
jgi:hypothetical protein